jgi:sec-independent protein translocase protein TatA
MSHAQDLTAGRGAPRPREKYMGELFTPNHLMVIAVIAIVFFGGHKLPELGQGLGVGLREFKEGIKGSANVTGGPGKPA